MPATGPGLTRPWLVAADWAEQTQSTTLATQVLLDNAVLNLTCREQLARRTNVTLDSTLLCPCPGAHQGQGDLLTPAKTHPHLEDGPSTATGGLRGRQAWGQEQTLLAPRMGVAADGVRVLTEPLSLLFSADVSFSFEALAVSEGAACVLEEDPWDDLFSVSVFDSESASC